MILTPLPYIAKLHKVYDYLYLIYSHKRVDDESNWQVTVSGLKNSNEQKVKIGPGNQNLIVLRVARKSALTSLI